MLLILIRYILYAKFYDFILKCFLLTQKENYINYNEILKKTLNLNHLEKMHK